MQEHRAEIARLLDRLERNDHAAAEGLRAVLFEAFRSEFNAFLARRPDDPRVDVVELVHATLDELANWDRRGEAHRLALLEAASVASGQVLHERAMSSRSERSGGLRDRVLLGGEFASGPHGVDLILFQDALAELDDRVPRFGQIARLRLLAGASVDETARILQRDREDLDSDWSRIALHLTAALGDAIGSSGSRKLDPATLETWHPTPSVVLPALEPHPHSIGPYEVLRKLGEGGVGTVFEAQSPESTVPVAIKLLHGGMVSPRTLQRFRREADVLRQLSHPGIAAFHDFGEVDAKGRRAAADSSNEDQRAFLAMELVVGDTLRNHCRGRRLDVPSRLELIARVCDALQHAHQLGVIHRDLKPANIVVCADPDDPVGRPKILDFGIARARDLDLHTMTDTRTGVLIGTVPYMSPEQVGASGFRVGRPQALG